MSYIIPSGISDNISKRVIIPSLLCHLYFLCQAMAVDMEFHCPDPPSRKACCFSAESCLDQDHNLPEVACSHWLGERIVGIAALGGATRFALGLAVLGYLSLYRTCIGNLTVHLCPILFPRPSFHSNSKIIPESASCFYLIVAKGTGSKIYRLDHIEVQSTVVLTTLYVCCTTNLWNFFIRICFLRSQSGAPLSSMI